MNDDDYRKAKNYLLDQVKALDLDALLENGPVDISNGANKLILKRVGNGYTIDLAGDLPKFQVNKNGTFSVVKSSKNKTFRRLFGMSEANIILDLLS